MGNNVTKAAGVPAGTIATPPQAAAPTAATNPTPLVTAEQIANDKKAKSTAGKGGFRDMLKRQSKTKASSATPPGVADAAGSSAATASSPRKTVRFDPQDLEREYEVEEEDDAWAAGGSSMDPVPADV